MDKLKGGWAMRTAWQQYAKIAKEHEIEKGKEDHLDIETRCGIEFGVGVFNLTCSLLPPRIMRVASVFGFPSSRATALTSLRFVATAGAIRSPVGTLALLSHHVGMQSAFGLGTTPHIPEAQALVSRCLADYPDGGLFLLMQGRIKRLQRDVEGGIAIYQRAVELKLQWRQLNDLISYELGWSHLGLLQHEQALAHFTQLKDNKWSRGFYRYMMALCNFSLRRKEEAVAILKDAPHVCGKKIQGKLIPAEEFVLRKAKGLLEGADMELALYEILFLWNVFPQMPTPVLLRIADTLKDWLQTRGLEVAVGAGAAADGHGKHASKDKGARDDEAVARLVLAGALAQAGSLDDAGHQLDTVDKLASHCKHDTYVGPFAAYERAIILTLRRASRAEREAALATCVGNNGEFDFADRLQFRCHLAAQELQLEGLV